MKKIFEGSLDFFGCGFDVYGGEFFAKFGDIVGGRGEGGVGKMVNAVVERVSLDLAVHRKGAFLPVVKRHIWGIKTGLAGDELAKLGVFDDSFSPERIAWEAEEVGIFVSFDFDDDISPAGNDVFFGLNSFIVKDFFDNITEWISGSKIISHGYILAYPDGFVGSRRFEMVEYGVRRCSMGEIFMQFLVYAVFGWVWETIYVSILSRKLVDRGFLVGPWLPIYGFGAMAILAVVQPVAQSALAVFLVGMGVATILEFFTGMTLQKIFKMEWWDYSEEKFNYRGVIALVPSLFWGLLALLLVYVVNGPVMEWSIFMVEELPWVVLALAMVFALDVGYSVYKNKKNTSKKSEQMLPWLRTKLAPKKSRK